MSEKNTKTLITPVFKVSFPNVFKPKGFVGPDGQMQGDLKYALDGIFDIKEIAKDPKEAARWKALKVAVQEKMKEKWGDKAAKMKLKQPFRDCEEKDCEGYDEGMVFFKMSSKERPGIVDGQREAIDDENEIYGGCYCRASVRPYFYDVSGNRGIAFGLNNIQKIKDGTRLSGRRKAEDEFDAVTSVDLDLDDLGDITD